MRLIIFVISYLYYNTRGILVDKIVTLLLQKIPNSFFPYCTDQWNELDPTIKNLRSISLFKNALLKFIRPTAAYDFDGTDHFGLKLLTRLRLGLSHLNEHKLRHNFHDTINPLCSCSLEPETVSHFLLHCPYHNIHRRTLFSVVSI